MDTDGRSRPDYPQPSNLTSSMPPAVVGSRAVQLATAAISADPAHPWKLAEVARTAGVSARTLQEAFQRDLDLSPMEYLRHTRLDGARRDLLAADPTTESVTEVASRWGFFHLGRFSQAYRAAFSELPSQTLATVPSN